MTEPLPSRAVVYCDGAFLTTNGKTAHGLIRRSGRYEVAALVDHVHAGKDAGEALDGQPKGIPVVATLAEAHRLAVAAGAPLTHFVMGLAPDGGRLPPEHRGAVVQALELGLEVHSGLHDYLGLDPDLARLAEARGGRIVDIRRPPAVERLHFFSGAIAEVSAPRIALLGTDSAVGKRTTAWLLVDALTAAGHRAELIGTGQTAWLQGSRFGIILDSLVNDFVAGEIEHAVVTAWRETRPDALVLEGQGSLLNPAYPGGFELLAAGRPAAVVLQHAPARREYDGFPGYPLHPLGRQIEAVRIISDRPVVAITVNHEGLDAAATRAACRAIEAETGLPAVDPLRDGLGPVVEALRPYLKAREPA